LASKIIDYCQTHPDYSDVIELCRDTLGTRSKQSPECLKEFDAEFGFVYLMKSGRFYKVGNSRNVERRNYELGIKLPEKLDMIRKIRTDDPVGIEAYWHSRFKDKRKQGEWFDLSKEDVSAFKRRKLM
jgi:hypothetical protein